METNTMEKINRTKVMERIELLNEKEEQKIGEAPPYMSYEEMNQKLKEKLKTNLEEHIFT